MPIQMTRTAKLALYFLRAYLILLLTLILIKFIRVFSSSNKASPATQEEKQKPN